MARRFTAPIFLGLITVLALVFLTSGTADKDVLRQTFQVEAVYHDSGNVEISYLDKSGKTDSVVLEVLGMAESYQKTFSGSEFVETVPFPTQSKFGWSVNPVVFEIEHEELGHIQLKTEIHSPDEPAPRVIYSRP